jgi:hypothetical protein
MTTTPTEAAGAAAAPEAPEAASPSALSHIASRIGTSSNALVDQGIARLGRIAEERKAGAADAVGTVVEIVRQFGDDAGERFGDTAGSAVHRGGDALDRLAKTVRNTQLDEIADGTRRVIGRNPVIAIGAASLLGFAAGRIFKAGLVRSGSGSQARAKEALA